jgi:hypothetical protein
MQGHRGIKIVKSTNPSGTLSEYNAAGKSRTAKAETMIDCAFHALIKFLLESELFWLLGFSWHHDSRCRTIEFRWPRESQQPERMKT